VTIDEKLILLGLTEDTATLASSPTGFVNDQDFQISAGIVFSRRSTGDAVKSGIQALQS
jgi:hypothetical protein